MAKKCIVDLSKDEKAELVSLTQSISYCRFEYINVYIFQRFELNAIPCYTCLTKFFPICLG